MFTWKTTKITSIKYYFCIVQVGPTWGMNYSQTSQRKIEMSVKIKLFLIKSVAI